MKHLFLAVLFTFLTTNAMAAPFYNNFEPTWTVIDNDYYTITDQTTNGPGDATFVLEYDKTMPLYDASFGIYTVNTDGSVTKIEIFDKTQDSMFPRPSTAVYIRNNNGWEVAVNNGGNPSSMSYAPFSNTFGFYFDMYNAFTYDTVDYTWFTDQSMNVDGNGNSYDTGTDHIVVTYNEGMADAYIFLSALPYSAYTFDDTVIHGVDINPVPEPASIYLLFFGLSALTFAKSKMKK